LPPLAMNRLSDILKRDRGAIANRPQVNNLPHTEMWKLQCVWHIDALWAARRELGNLATLQESTRAIWGWTFLEQFVQDLRYGLRTMLHNRAFTALAVLSLALGIGEILRENKSGWLRARTEGVSNRSGHCATARVTHIRSPKILVDT